MSLSFQFAVVSDLHIALPHTCWDSPQRLHLVEVSIPAFEQILAQLTTQKLDFLLLPGDLVQHGELENHQWLVNRLSQLPFPTYVVPGNHDVLSRQGSDRSPSLTEFTQLYQAFGYDHPGQPYYHQEIAPNLHLIGLNSNGFDAVGQPFYTGYLDTPQLDWLDRQLATLQGQCILVMLHHNALEHLPGQARSAMGRRYMVANAADLTQRLQKAGVQFMFTGHLHVQDIARAGNLYEITTGSLVSYPHPYRLVQLTLGEQGQGQLQVQSASVDTVPQWPDLQAHSRHWMGQRSLPFIVKLLSEPPLSLERQQAEAYAPYLQNFWADIAAGDALFQFPELPAAVQAFCHRFSALDADGNYHPIDNQATLPRIE